MSDPFELLGVPRVPMLDQSALKSALHVKAAQLHPDKAGGDAQRFAELKGAYDELVAPGTRLRRLVEGSPHTSATPPSELFMLVGTAVAAARKAGAKQSESPLLKAMAAAQTHAARKALESAHCNLHAWGGTLTGRLEELHNKWPQATAQETSLLASEFTYFSKWKKELEEELFRLGSQASG